MFPRTLAEIAGMSSGVANGSGAGADDAADLLRGPITRDQ